MGVRNTGNEIKQMKELRWFLLTHNWSILRESHCKRFQGVLLLLCCQKEYLSALSILSTVGEWMISNQAEAVDQEPGRTFHPSIATANSTEPWNFLDLPSGLTRAHSGEWCRTKISPREKKIRSNVNILPMVNRSTTKAVWLLTILE